MPGCLAAWDYRALSAADSLARVHWSPFSKYSICGSQHGSALISSRRSSSRRRSTPARSGPTSRPGHHADRPAPRGRRRARRPGVCQLRAERAPSSRLRRRSASALRALRALRTPRCGPLSRLSAAGRARRSRGFGRGSDRDAAAGERGDCRRDRGRIRVIDRTHTSGFNVIVVDPRSSSRCSSSAGRVDAAGQEEQ